jgi:hypothetical protein
MTRPELLAFHNEVMLKTRLLREIIKHRKADAIIRGTYGVGEGKEWKGCALGCALHSLNLISELDAPTNDPSRYLTELGIPNSIARLEDQIFEGLPEAKAKLWPERFTKAIRVGADLSLVTPQFMVWLMDGQRKYAEGSPEVLSAIAAVRALHARIVSGGMVSDSEWAQARLAASAASAVSPTRAAWSAASAAIVLRNAAGAANAVKNAADAAWGAAFSATWSAADAAWTPEGVTSPANAAGRAAYEEMADKLVALLEAA